MFTAINEMPVVQPGPSSGLARHIKSYWMNDVQSAARSSGRSTDIARVVGDLWMDQDDVKWWRGHYMSLPSAGHFFRGIVNGWVRDLRY